MPLNPHIFFTRLLSAIVFSAVMMGSLIYSEWAMVFLFFLITVLAVREYVSLVEKIVQASFTKSEKMNVTIASISTYLLVIALPTAACDNMANAVLSKLFFYFLGLVIGALAIFFVLRKNTKSIYLLTVLGYVPIALGLLIQLRYHSNILPILLVLFIWMNDTMAYMTGSLIGKTPFFPNISPKKTLEGTIGGAVFTLLLASVWGYYTSWMPLIHWLMIAVIVSTAGTVGDLLESKLKRLAGVKDSGQLMPGHGGALDRFDSLLFATPFVYLYAVWFIPCFELKIL